MKTDLQIKRKMELLDSPNWLEGRAGHDLLGLYHAEIISREEASLKRDLEIEVLRAKEQLFHEETLAKFTLVRVQIILWMLDDSDTIKLIHAVPLNESYVEKRLDIVCERYEIKAPAGQSEEE